MQLDREWITIGWAVQAAALAWFGRRVAHPGLIASALTLAMFVTLRLVVNPKIASYYIDHGPPVLNWTAYSYLLPALLFAFSAHWIQSMPFSKGALADFLRKTAAPAFGISVVAIVFVWINLNINLYFADSLDFSTFITRLAARDLSMSIAWALYAVTLLGWGTWKNHLGMRWVSLVMLTITSFKVFLYDLSHLHDLYRVASLFGLALSLITVSLVYQRFISAQCCGSCSEKIPKCRPSILRHC